MRMPVCLDERLLGNGLAEDWGSFLDVSCEPWCSRGLRRSLVLAIIRWVATCIETIGGPAWKGVGLHALHAWPVNTALGCCER